MMFNILRTSLVLLFSLIPLTHGQVIPDGSRALIIIQQEGPGGILGSWELVSPGNRRKQGGGSLSQLPLEQTGVFFLSATPPQGGAASMEISLNNEILQSLQRPQASFTIQEGQIMHVKITYTFVHVGTVAVHSDPPGLPFELKGPNNISFTGTTPATFSNTPEGQYTVYFQPIEGCRSPQAKSLFLSRESRISLSITLDCDAATEMRKKIQDDDNPYLSLEVDGNRVIYTDVPKDVWFSTYIAYAIRVGILSGYRDESGALNGTFGPDKPVTVGELAKIAHRLIGLDETKRSLQSPGNPNALSAWFTPFIASAEEQGWTIFNDETILPSRPATRSEVVITLLQIFDISLTWPKGTAFQDVTKRTHFASAIETAARDSLISGHTDEHGVSTGTFGPDEPINRAEMAKLVKTTLELYKRPQSFSSQGL